MYVSRHCIYLALLRSTGIQEADWYFKTTFVTAQLDLSAAHVDVVFEGLDTYCDIYLVCSARSQDYVAPCIGAQIQLAKGMAEWPHCRQHQQHVHPPPPAGKTTPASRYQRALAPLQKPLAGSAAGRTR
jgi:hypothetical protein